MTPLFAFLTPTTVAVLALLGVIIFGRRLPEIGRSLGKTIVEFKKGVGGLEDDLDVAGKPFRPGYSGKPPAEPVRPPQRVAATAPKFEDPPPVPRRKLDWQLQRRSRCSLWGVSVRFAKRAANSAARVLSSHGRSHRFESCAAQFIFYGPASRQKPIDCRLST